MPIKTRSLRMKRSRKNEKGNKKENEKKNEKKNRTIRKKKDKRVWMYKIGIVSLFYRVPVLHVNHSFDSKEINTNKGGASDMDSNISKILFEQLPGGTTDKDIRDFLSKKDTKLVKTLLKSSSQPALASVLEELKKPQPNILDKSGLTVAGNALLAWVKKRQLASSIIQSIKEKAKSSLTDKEFETIEKTLNSENVCEVPGQGITQGITSEGLGQSLGALSSMSSKAFSGVKDGTVSLGNFLAPQMETDPNRRRQNDTSIQLLWYPRSNIHYRKGNSTAVSKDKIKYGDFMIYIEPERYADITAYFSDTTNSVEDLFANILNGCSDSFCLKGEPIQQPYKKQVLEINNFQPEFDDKEMQKTSLSL